MKLNIVEVSSTRSDSLTQRIELALEFNDSDYLMVDTFAERTKEQL
jgi:hypothetical protein